MANGLAKLEQAVGEDVDGLLGRHGLRVDADTWERLLPQVALALHQASGRLRRRAHGDYSPDPGAARFPDWKAIAVDSTACESATMENLLILVGDIAVVPAFAWQRGDIDHPAYPRGRRCVSRLGQPLAAGRIAARTLR